MQETDFVQFLVIYYHMLIYFGAETASLANTSARRLRQKISGEIIFDPVLPRQNIAASVEEQR